MSAEAETVKMPSTNLEAELKEVNKNLRSLSAAILGLDKKLEAIETNTRDDIKKMTWFKKRNDSVDVNVRISVVSVGDINTVQQQFNCEFYLTLRWEEPNLKHMIGRDEEIDWSNQWEPGIYFVDLIQIEKYERNETLCRPRIVRYCSLCPYLLITRPTSMKQQEHCSYFQFQKKLGSFALNRTLIVKVEDDCRILHQTLQLYYKKAAELLN